MGLYNLVILGDFHLDDLEQIVYTEYVKLLFRE